MWRIDVTRQRAECGYMAPVHGARPPSDPASAAASTERGLALLPRIAAACDELARTRPRSVAAAEDLLTLGCAEAMALEQGLAGVTAQIDGLGGRLRSQSDADRLRALLAERSALGTQLRHLRAAIVGLRASLRP